MDYNLDYYSGKDIPYPNKPKKPLLRLGGRVSPEEFRAHADEVEKYEVEFAAYCEDKKLYNSKVNQRMEQLYAQIKIDYHLSDKHFDALWNFAYEDGHDYGLSEIMIHFDKIYEFATHYNKL